MHSPKMQRNCLEGFDLEQIDIAPTIAKVMGIPFQADGRSFKKIIAYGKGCTRMILLIIDSFGYSQYLSRRFFQNTRIIGSCERTYRCKANADKTTPAIASILCGRKPEVHKIYSTGNVYNSYIKSVPEIASEQGVRSAVIMEEEGALTFRGRIDIIKPVKDREDIIEFDSIIKKATIEVIKEGSQLVVTHIRALDKLGYTLGAIRSVNQSITEIAKACETKSLILLCGDHPPHGSKEYLVPLVASRII